LLLITVRISVNYFLNILLSDIKYCTPSSGRSWLT